MATTVVDTVSSHLETVSPKLVELHDQSQHIAGLVKARAQVQKVSRYFWRQPVALYAGGTDAKYKADGGSLGTGSGAKMTHFQAAYFYHRYAGRITKEAMDTSKTSSQAIVNALAYQLAQAMKELNAIEDIHFHTDGTGKISGVSSAQSDSGAATASSITLAGTSDYLGVNRIREGMAVDVWVSTTRATPYGSLNWFTVTKVDYDNKVVYLDVGSTTGSAIGSSAYITLPWIDSGESYGPASPTSFQSTYPGVPTQSGGVGGDSFVHGFPYMTDYTSSNYFYGVQKSSFYKLQPPSVNASSTPFEWDYFHRMIAKIQQRSDDDQWKNMIGICHMAQRAQIASLGVAITTNFMQGTEFGGMKDMIPNDLGYTQVFNVAGVPHYVSKRADRAEINYINPSVIAIAEAEPVGFIDNGGSKLFEGRDSTGAVQAYWEFFISHGYDYFAQNPNAGFGRIYGLTIPSGFEA